MVELKVTCPQCSGKRTFGGNGDEGWTVVACSLCDARGWILVGVTPREVHRAMRAYERRQLRTFIKAEVKRELAVRGVAHK